jgi:hypothetical protein
MTQPVLIVFRFSFRSFLLHPRHLSPDGLLKLYQPLPMAFAYNNL